MPIRCFEGNARPNEPFWRVRNAEETGSEPEMEMYGYISEFSWFDDDVTPAMFKDQLYALGQGGPITVRINSGGGDVFAASVIRATMADYPGHITTRIDGMAASAAVIVAMAGKTIKIQDTAYMMIHDPAFSVMWATLDIETLGRMHETLKAIKSGIVDTYQSKTGMSRERLAKMMSEETWMSASEAVKLGFADQVLGGDGAAQNMTVLNAVQNYRNVPAALLLAATKTPDTRPDISDAEKRFRAEVKLVLGGE